MNQQEIGRFISHCRKEKGLTQTQLAEILGVSDKSISRWETGKTLPNFKTMKRIDIFCKENSIDFDVTGEVWTDE